jgi:hypothetical protein
MSFFQSEFWNLAHTIQMGRPALQIFAVVEPKTRKHLSQVTPDRSALQFALTIKDLVLEYPSARTIHLVMDNLDTHCSTSLIDHLGEQEGGYIRSRLSVHYTPKHGSWLNQAEIELSLISQQSPQKTNPLNRVAR